MRIEKWGFLLSYAIYLVFCIFFALFSEDKTAINSMVSAITIASTLVSVSDLFFCILGINKKEKESMFGLYNLSWEIANIYLAKIQERYGEKAYEILTMLEDMFEKDEERIKKFCNGNLSVEEKQEIKDKVKRYGNEELVEFVMDYLEEEFCDDEMIENDEHETIKELYSKQEKRERKYNFLASSIAVLGFVVLLVLLTIRINIPADVNNIFTVSAFLSVIINLLFKDYYKANLLKKLEKKRKKLLEDFKRETVG